MKKQYKNIVKSIINIVKSIIVMVGSVILLFCGVLWKEAGFEGKGIVLIMCSLYLALWVAAGIVRDDVCAKLEEIKDEISKSGTAEKSVQ
jgi:ABC-type transport system involved in Fe-S cluster assembly fused permease/ATPase subunit